MKSVAVCQTERLVGRRVLPDDLEFYRRIFQDPAVAATLGGVRSDEDTQQLIERGVAQWDRHGYGLWLWRHKADGRFVGRGGVQNVFVGGNDEVEVGYALVPEFWGQGLATEIARASVRVAFEKLGLTDIVSFTLPTNLASRRVMEKAGFKFERDIIYKDLPAVLYRLKRDLSNPA